MSEEKKTPETEADLEKAKPESTEVAEVEATEKTKESTEELTESQKVQEKLKKQIEKKQEQRERMGGLARIAEYVKTEHKWENFAFVFVAALTLILGGLMLTGFLVPNNNIPFIRDNSLLFAIVLTLVGLAGLIYSLYPFFKPAFPEFKKITWLTLPKFVANSIRVFVFLIVFALLFQLYELFITSILYRIIG